MRKVIAVAAAAVTAASAAVAVGLAAPAPQASAAPVWRNVEIGGGGFVPGIVFNQTEPGLVYARTDIGGAYRMDPATGRWVPLLDHVGWAEWGWNGVVSLASDPVEPDNVYVAAGMYTNSWDANNGAILRSADRGRTWAASRLPFKLGGNMPGRGMGERLAVDPNDNRVLYLGAPSGHGLWRSTDKGVTWAEVTAFPNPGDYVADPDDPSGYGSDIQGVVWVTFDPTSASPGSRTRTIYVGVADKENTVYRSTDAGVTWERVAGQPTGYIAHKGVLADGFLYLATSDTGGPYDGGKGDVWKLDTASGAWTRISPVPSTSADAYFGYSGLSVDRQNPGTLMVATQISWWPDIILFRSTDGGATWTRAWDYTSYPNRSFRYEMDVAEVPWLTFGANPQPPEVAPKLGWMTEALEIDPFDSDRMLYGTGATIYGTENLTAWDTGGKALIKPVIKGLEETAVLDLISPPSGAPLISGLGDIGGFRHDDLTAIPDMLFTGPVFTTTTSLDYAEKSPNIMVRAGNFTDADRPGDSHVAFSTDGGSTWFQGGEPGGINSGGTVASSADGATFVWSPGEGQVVRSVGFGTSWTAVRGLPAQSVVESDRVNAGTFYGFKDGTFYTSTDGGATFAAKATGLPASAKFKAVPGKAGDIWLAGDLGLFRSTDFGATFTKVSSVAGARNIGFGKAAPGRDYPALFLVGTVGSVRDAVFISDDLGATWRRMNDDQHQYGNMGEALTGDPRVYGRVYLGTNGRGIVYADAGGSTPPTTTTTTTTTTTPPPAGACSVRYAVTGSWGGGFQASVRVTNNTLPRIDGWTLTYSFTGGQRVTQLWNGSYTQTGADVTVRGADWNKVLAPGQSAEVGFLGSWQGANPPPLGFRLNGTVCGAA